MKKRIKTGINGLDKLLKGGLLEKKSVLLSGPCGSGKSILAMQFIYNGIKQENEPGLYVSFEEEKQSIIENMATLGFNLEELEKKKKLMIVGGEAGKLDYFMQKVGARTDNIIEEIREIVKDNKIKRVVIDSVSILTLLCNNDEERRRTITKLASTLSELGCTSLLISETKEGTLDLSRHGIEEFIVDGVIALFQLRQGDKFIPGIVVRKMRGTDHERGIRLFKITKNGIVVYPNETMFTDI